MKKLFVALMLVLLVSSFSFAQINKGWDGTKPEVYKGSKAFVFVYSPFVSNEFKGVPISPLLNTLDSTTLNTPRGLANVMLRNLYGVGFRYFVASNFDLGIGLNFGSASIEEQAVPPVGGTVTNSKWSASTIGFSLEGNYRFKSLYSISPYIGLNANVLMLSATEEHVTGATFKDEFKTTIMGGGLHCGFDWYFVPGMSLGARYTLGFSSMDGLEETLTNAAGTQTNKGPKVSTFGTGVASIFLNVHL